MPSPTNRPGGFRPRAREAIYDPNSLSAIETARAVEAYEAEQARKKADEQARYDAEMAAYGERLAARRAKADAEYTAALPVSLPDVMLCGHTNGGLAPGLWYKARQTSSLGEPTRYVLSPVTSFRRDVLRAYATGAVRRQHDGHRAIAKAELGRRGECYFGADCPGLLKARPRDWLCEGCRAVRAKAAAAPQPAPSGA